MNKRLLGILTVISLLVMMIPIGVFADSSITLYDIGSKYTGNTVVISGTTTLEAVSIRVLQPDGMIIYIDQLDETGDFERSFTLADNATLGTYEVIAGAALATVKKTFEVSKYVPPSTTSGAWAGDTNKEPEVKSDGTVTVPVEKPKLDKATGKAKTVVPADAIDKALEKAKPSTDGVKKVVLEISKVDGATEYVQEIPVKTLVANSLDKELEINTPEGSITIPGNMLTSLNLKNEAKVELSIGKADKTSISKDINEKIGDRPVIELNIKAGGKAVEWNNPDAPVTVTFDYKATADELKNPEHIVVWYIDGNNKVVAIPNGAYDVKTGKVTFTTVHFSKYAVTYVLKTFKDIEKYSWAKKQIEVLASKGITEFATDDKFKPEANITRGEYVGALIRALGLTAKADSNFSDVNASDYYYDEIAIAKELGIAQGGGNNKFSPTKAISRQDMMVLTIRALNIARKISSKGTAADIKKYKDASQVAKYAVESVATMVKAGYIEGNLSTQKLNPNGATTRAAAAVMLYRIINK